MHYCGMPIFLHIFTRRPVRYRLFTARGSQADPPHKHNTAQNALASRNNPLIQRSPHTHWRCTRSPQRSLKLRTMYVHAQTVSQTVAHTLAHSLVQTVVYTFSQTYIRGSGRHTRTDRTGQYAKSPTDDVDVAVYSDWKGLRPRQHRMHRWALHDRVVAPLWRPWHIMHTTIATVRLITALQH